MWEPSDKPVQLVKHLHKVPAKKRIFPAMASIKYDGVYAFILPDGRIYSRTGKLNQALDHIGEVIRSAPQMSPCPGISPHVLLVEVYVPGWDVHKISGSFRRQSEAFIQARIYVHDAIPYKDFQEGKSNVAFKYRARVAERLACHYMFDYIAQWTIPTEEEAYTTAESLINDEEEGLILRDPNAGWGAGVRNETCTKIKIEEKAKCVVLGVVEGEGKNKGIASLIVDYNRHNQVVSGGDYVTRAAWWNDPDSIYGKTAIIEYMCETPNGLMREPRLKGFV